MPSNPFRDEQAHYLTLDVNRATHVSDEVRAIVKDQYNYHAWNDDQKAAGAAIREILIEATLMIIGSVPPCPDRSQALRKLREARMDCNSAITHRGRY